MSKLIDNFVTSNSVPDSAIPTVRLRFDAVTGEMVEQHKSEPFLKGPISIAWLNRAALLGGKTLNVALAICWLSGMNGSQPVKLSKKALKLFHVSSDAALDALSRMESSGLIRLQRNPGQRISIEVLAIHSKAD